MKSSLAQPAFQCCVRAVLFVFTGLLILPGVRPASAQVTAFSYQGQLSAVGGPANGLYDFRFKLYSDSFGNNQAGLAHLTNGVALANGLFSFSIDFGAGIFNGSNYWLEVDVKTNNADSYTVLSPLQAVAPVPYAIFANAASNLNGSLPASQISGVIPSASLGGNYAAPVTFSNANGTFSGDGRGLTGVNATALGGLSSGSFWQLAGNVGTNPNTNYVGTTDNQPLEFHINATRALRIEPGGVSAGNGLPSGAPNLIGGSSVNFAAAGVVGVTIGGGGATNLGGVLGMNYGSEFANSVASDFGSIGGGSGNAIQTGSIFSTIGGGQENTIQAQAGAGTIGGGTGNGVQNGAYFSTVAGGGFNTIQGASEASSIGGGVANTIESNADNSTIAGGGNNAIQTGAGYSTIAGGTGNTIQSNSIFSTIGGGDGNAILADAQNGASTVAGGLENTIYAAQYATIGGGIGNVIQSNDWDCTIGGGGANNILSNSQVSTISGGYGNVIQGNAGSSTIAGGWGNTVLGESGDSVIGGGYQNTINTNSGYSEIGGGIGNVIAASYATIDGGLSNSVQEGSSGSTIAGGAENIIQTNEFSGIGGGFGNRIQSSFGIGACTIAGGSQNSVQSSFYSTIGGGNDNTIQWNCSDSTIAGGLKNSIQSNSGSCTIGGGYENTVQSNSTSSTVAGGFGNTIQVSGNDSTVGGGYNNVVQSNNFGATLAGGRHNVIGANTTNSVIGGGSENLIHAGIQFAMIPGGYSNIVGGSFALAAGCNAQALHQGAFVWADSQNAAFASTANDQFNVRAQGGVRFASSTGGAAETVSWTPGSGSWSFSSDRDLKDRFEPVNEGSILERVCKLPLAEWSYKGYGQRHIGAMAQDFHALFPLNESDKSLNETDLHGVELAAIKGLNQKLEQQNAAKDAEIRDLRQSVADLKKLVESLASKK